MMRARVCSPIYSSVDCQTFPTISETPKGCLRQDGHQHHREIEGFSPYPVKELPDPAMCFPTDGRDRPDLELRTPLPFVRKTLARPSVVGTRILNRHPVIGFSA
jgi:hypothetical protein